VSVIRDRDKEIIAKVNAVFGECPNLVVLGNKDANRIPIYSFVIRHPESNRFLHHNYVSGLLNDLFGIQSRSGCACAGPYAQTLLGISPALADQYESVLLADPRLDTQIQRWRVEFSQHELLRPGFVRINFPFFYTNDEVDFICKAVVWWRNSVGDSCHCIA